VGAQSQIAQEQSLRPSGPVTHDKAWIEMVHRYFATAVGALITAIAVATWRLAGRRDADAPSRAWAGATLAWVCVQGAFGALTVTMKLYPAIVTLHLLGGMMLLALLAAQVESGRARPLASGNGFKVFVGVVFALSIVQIALGGWVSTNYAVLACRDFPTCQGSWWPPMDFTQGFTVLRPLGENGEGGWLPFEALTAIHYVHRMMAVLVVAALLALAWQLRAAGRKLGEGTPRAAQWIAGIAAWQVATGLSNVLLEWPLPSAVAHTGGAAVLVIVLTTLSVRLWQGRRAPASRIAGAVSRRGALHHV
jgi:cytochrome c oxidase assembly protein subunit 15